MAESTNPPAQPAAPAAPAAPPEPAGQGATPTTAASTSIDSLVELLKLKGRMELHQIADVLKVDPLIVEGWAKVLESGNLAKIVNEVGKMYVEPVNLTKEQERAIGVAAETERTTMLAETKFELGNLEKFSVQLDAIAATQNAAEGMFKEKIPALELQLRRINRIYLTLNEENQKMEGMRKKVEESNEHVNKKVSELYTRIETIDPTSSSATRGEISKMALTVKSAGEYENQMDLIARSKDRAMAAIKKSMEVQIKALEREMAKAQRGVDTQMRLYRDQVRQEMEAIKMESLSLRNPARQVNEFKKTQELAKKELLEARARFNDEYERTAARMKASQMLLSGEIKAMMVELDALKAAYGQVGRIYDSLQKTKSDIALASKKLAELKAGATKLAADLATVETTKMSVEAKVAATKGISSRLKKLGDEVNDTKTLMDDLSKTTGETAR